MHEMSIAVELLRQLESIAAERDIEQIEEITVQTGLMRQVVPDALEVAFQALAAGTIADGAAIVVEAVDIEAKCCSCDLTFVASIDNFLCPTCGQANVDIIKGNEIILSSLTARQV